MTKNENSNTKNKKMKLKHKKTKKRNKKHKTQNRVCNQYLNMVQIHGLMKIEIYEIYK